MIEAAGQLRRIGLRAIQGIVLTLLVVSYLGYSKGAAPQEAEPALDDGAPGGELIDPSLNVADDLPPSLVDDDEVELDEPDASEAPEDVTGLVLVLDP